MPFVKHVAHELIVLVQRHCTMFQTGFVLCVKKGNVYLLRVCRLLQRAHSISARAHKSSPSQVPTALLTTALIVLWLSLYGGDPYSNCLLKDVVIFLCID